jgi:hypothetical protein
MRAILVLRLMTLSLPAAAQTIQTISREQSRLLFDVQGYERASEAYRYVQAANYSSETYAVSRWLPRDAGFGIVLLRELAPNYTFRPSGRNIDSAWVVSHLAKLKERQVVLEAPLIDTEKLRLVQLTAEPASCVAFESVVGDIGVLMDSRSGTRHAVLSGIVCSQTTKRLGDDDIRRVLVGVRIVGPNGAAQPAFNPSEVFAQVKQ